MYRIIVLMYMTTRESRDCECGGRYRLVPILHQKHLNTEKHQTWQFEKLCIEFLKLTELNQKKEILVEMRKIVLTGLVQ